MISFLLGAATALLALQSPPASTGSEAERAPIASLDELPIEESARLRCGVAFALVGRWQVQGDPRGSAYPNMETEGGREFFVQAFAPLVLERGMTQDEVASLALREVEALANDGDGAQAEAMMPACLLMKEAAGF